jgi:hypothetical protein
MFFLQKICLGWERELMYLSSVLPRFSIQHTDDFTYINLWNLGLLGFFGNYLGIIWELFGNYLPICCVIGAALAACATDLVSSLWAAISSLSLSIAFCNVSISFFC